MSPQQTPIRLTREPPIRPARSIVGETPKVLCFIAYFKEAVHESPLENHRIRQEVVVCSCVCVGGCGGLVCVTKKHLICHLMYLS